MIAGTALDGQRSDLLSVFRRPGKAAKRIIGDLFSSNLDAKMMTFQRIFFALTPIVLLIALCGCSDKPNSAPVVARPYADLSGQQVLEKIQAAYSSADSYSDQAVLYLTYRLNGRAVQEPHPWAVAVDRKGNRLGTQFFDTVVAYDGQTLGCRIYDIETENYDNQFLMIESSTPPIDQMLNDPIARRYVGGGSELPLNDDNPVLESVLPPTIALTTGQSPFPWIQGPESIERLEDQTVEGVVCFHLLTKYRGEPCEMWIEQESGMIHQLLLPNSVLLNRLSHSNAVTDLKLVARFHGCQFDQPVKEDLTRVAAPEGSSLVRSFVRIPEAFPSELIGKQAPPFTLHNTDGLKVLSTKFQGKPTAFLWIAGYDAEDGIRQLSKLRETFGESVNLAVIYSEAEMVDPTGGSYEMIDSLKQFAQREKIAVSFYCDFQLDVSSRLRIKALPSVLVMDPNLKIQFTKPLSRDNWASELANAITRVSQGHDIAQEMIDDYGRFYSLYRAKLLEVRAASRSSVEAMSASARIPKASAESPILWSSRMLTQPGSVSVAEIQNEPEIAVLDGFRTVHILDEEGAVQEHQELPLPENQGVTRIRIAERLGKRFLVAFSRFGTSVFWFDHEFNQLGTFSRPKGKDIRITDCQVQDVGQGEILLVISTEQNGLFLLDPGSGEFKAAPKYHATDLEVNGRTIAGIANGRPFTNAGGGGNANAFENWQFSQLSIAQFGGQTSYCGLGTSDDGSWHAFGMDGQFGIQWKTRVGQQDFDRDIEPLVGLESGQRWVVANSDFGFDVLSRAGELLFMNSVDSGLRGMAAFSHANRSYLVYTDGKEVHCVGIN